MSKHIIDVRFNTKCVELIDARIEESKRHEALGVKRMTRRQVVESCVERTLKSNNIRLAEKLKDLYLNKLKTVTTIRLQLEEEAYNRLETYGEHLESMLPIGFKFDNSYYIVCSVIACLADDHLS